MQSAAVPHSGVCMGGTAALSWPYQQEISAHLPGFWQIASFLYFTHREQHVVDHTRALNTHPAASQNDAWHSSAGRPGRAEAQGRYQVDV